MLFQIRPLVFSDSFFDWEIPYSHLTYSGNFLACIISILKQTLLLKQVFLQLSINKLNP